jgi:hypothetical protein
MERRREMVIAMVILFTASALLSSTADHASGDGMAIYRETYSNADPERNPYKATFEARQLASVTLLNDSYQRIDLFLSIYSLRPGNNLTVMVPIRERPVDVTSNASTDASFLERIGYDDVVKESKKQDLSYSSDRLSRRMANGFGLTAASTVGTALSAGGLHLARTYKAVHHSHAGYWGDAHAMGEGDGDNYKKEVSEIERYEFEGTSVRVLSVSANATIEDFVAAVPDMDLPHMTREVVEEYKGHYALVIDSVTSPPIDNEEYGMLMEIIPGTMYRIIKDVNTRPTLSQNGIDKWVYEYTSRGLEELARSGLDIVNTSKKYGFSLPHDWEYQMQSFKDVYHPYNQYYYHYEWMPFNLSRILKDLLNSIYGYTEFSGNILSITSKLNDGRMFFPLGTSKGWENPVGRTVVAFKVDDGKRLKLDPDPMYEAFIGGDRIYITEIGNGNPGYDITAEVEEANFLDRPSSVLSTVLYKYVDWIAFILIIIANIVIFLFLLNLFSRVTGDRGLNVFTWRNLLIGASNLVLSAPLTYMIFVRDPISGYINSKNGRYWKTYALTGAVFFLLQIAILVLAVV